jgi:hypothetical protein
MVARVRWLTTVARTIFRPSPSGKMVILGKSKTGMAVFISTDTKAGGAKSGAV